MASAGRKKFRPRVALALLLIAGNIGGFFAYFSYWNYPFLYTTREPSRFFWLSAMFTSESSQILQDHPEDIDMLSPTWYSLVENGSIYCAREQDNATAQEMLDIVSFCDANGIGVHPLVAGGNQTNMRNLLENAANQQNLIDSLQAAFSKYGFDGINIDLEGIPDDLRDEFNAWFHDLRSSMDASKLLSIDVPAKTWDNTLGWAGWCDYETLGGIADMFMIMTYDAHGGWTDPGEVAPTSWVKDVMDYGIRAIPLEKLYIGIPRYGYDWSTDPSWENWGYGFGYFQDRINAYGGTVTRTDDGKELRLEYVDGSGYDHVAYFCDVETTRAKEAFLSNYPIGGYCYWHLSSGDPAYFTG